MARATASRTYVWWHCSAINLHAYKLKWTWWWREAVKLFNSCVNMPHVSSSAQFFFVRNLLTVMLLTLHVDIESATFTLLSICLAKEACALSQLFCLNFNATRSWFTFENAINRIDLFILQLAFFCRWFGIPSFIPFHTDKSICIVPWKEIDIAPAISP